MKPVWNRVAADIRKKLTLEHSLEEPDPYLAAKPAAHFAYQGSPREYRHGT